jgi:hypothetical protein
MYFEGVDFRECQLFQNFIALESPWLKDHMSKEFNRDKFSRNEIIIFFASHSHRPGRTYASVFAKLCKRCEKSQTNPHYAGEYFRQYFQREPSKIECVLYLICYHRIFGFSKQMLLTLPDKYKQFCQEEISKRKQRS